MDAETKRVIVNVQNDIDALAQEVRAGFRLLHQNMENLRKDIGRMSLALVKREPEAGNRMARFLDERHRVSADRRQKAINELIERSRQRLQEPQ